MRKAGLLISFSLIRRISVHHEGAPEVNPRYGSVQADNVRIGLHQGSDTAADDDDVVVHAGRMPSG